MFGLQLFARFFSADMACALGKLRGKARRRFRDRLLVRLLADGSRKLQAILSAGAARYDKTRLERQSFGKSFSLCLLDCRRKRPSRGPELIAFRDLSGECLKGRRLLDALMLTPRLVLAWTGEKEHSKWIVAGVPAVTVVPCCSAAEPNTCVNTLAMHTDGDINRDNCHNDLKQEGQLVWRALGWFLELFASLSGAITLYLCGARKPLEAAAGDGFRGRRSLGSHGKCAGAMLGGTVGPFVPGVYMPNGVDVLDQRPEHPKLEDPGNTLPAGGKATLHCFRWQGRRVRPASGDFGLGIAGAGLRQRDRDRKRRQPIVHSHEPRRRTRDPPGCRRTRRGRLSNSTPAAGSTTATISCPHAQPELGDRQGGQRHRPLASSTVVNSTNDYGGGTLLAAGPR